MSTLGPYLLQEQLLQKVILKPQKYVKIIAKPLVIAMKAIMLHTFGVQVGGITAPYEQTLRYTYETAGGGNGLE